MFCLVATLLSADQNLMAPNLTAVARDFNFTDAQRDKYLGGVIAAAFFLLGAPAALLIGYLSDTMNRAKLLFWVVVLGRPSLWYPHAQNLTSSFYCSMCLNLCSASGAFSAMLPLMSEPRV